MSPSLGIPQCYDDPCDNTNHPGWWHLDDWAQLTDVLLNREPNVMAVDRDGDRIDEYHGEVDPDYPDRHYVIENSARYSYPVESILVNREPNPYSPEDEADVLKSIAESYSNIRLSDN